MANRANAVTEKESKRRLAALEKTKDEKHPNGFIAVAAKALKISPSALSKWLRDQGTTVGRSPVLNRERCIEMLKQQVSALGRAPKREELRRTELGYLWRAHWTTMKDFLEAAGIGETATALDVRREQRYRDQITSRDNEIRRLSRELNAMEDFRHTVFGLGEQKIEPPKWMTNPLTALNNPGIPVLFGSDYQAGEVIRAGELDGINEYNSDIFRARLRLMIEKAIELSYFHMARAKYPGIVYMRGGDAISGNIHQELRETNDAHSIPAVKMLVEEECAGIENLLKRFNRVDVWSIPGNHGRDTEKSFSKLYAEHNYETLAAWMIEREFKHEPRVTFNTPMSGDVYRSIYGYWFLLTHGDRMGTGGGKGFIGEAAPIIRGAKLVIDMYAKLHRHIDYICTGHYHTRMEHPYGFANGCLSGFNEYARGLRKAPARAEQWFFFVNPKYGVTARWPIMLSPKPKLGEKYIAEDVAAVFEQTKTASRL